MIDGIIKGDGNSRRLKSVANFLTLYPTYADFVAAIVAGTLPIDLLYDATGWDVEGTPLNKANLLDDETATLYGLTGNQATINKALALAKNSDTSSYLAFCANANAASLEAAFGRGNEDLIVGLGKQLAMYAWYKGTSSVSSPFTNLITCNTINDIIANAAALAEFRANSYLVALAEASIWGAYKLLNTLPIYSYGTVNAGTSIAVTQTASGTMVRTLNSDNFAVSGQASGAYGAVGSQTLINVTGKTKLYMIAKGSIHANCRIGYNDGAVMNYDASNRVQFTDATNLKLYSFDITGKTSIGPGVGLAYPYTANVYAMWVL